MKFFYLIQKLNEVASILFLRTKNIPNGFDSELYLRIYPDLVKAKVNPIRHYLRYGRKEGRIFSLPKEDYGVCNFKANMDTVLIVSHEASRTGAPVLSLNIAQSFVKRYNVVVLLLGGGPLEGAFQQSGSILVNASNLKGNQGMIDLLIGDLCKKFKFKFALINSIESREVLPALCNFFVPTISLIHEFASYTRPRNAMRYAFFWASEVVFSTRLTLENALAEYPDLPDLNAHVLPQGRCQLPLEGLTIDEIHVESNRVRHLIRPCSLPSDTVVVLGAGFVQMRKGVDLFLECASRVVSKSAGENYRFVWVGKGYDPEDDAGYSVYLADQIRRSGLQDHIVFIDETTAIETAYEEADLMLLSSRLDPLPNVAIDAMAHGVPVLCFDKTTGISDFLTESGLGSHCVANYLDSSDMSNKILALGGDPVIRESVAKKCRDASKEYFNMQEYISHLESLARDSANKIRQEKVDTHTILGSDLFRQDFSCPLHLRGLSIEGQVRSYVRGWASGIDRRKPLPGFHPGIYLEQHGVDIQGSDPFAAYLRAGRPAGSWSYPIINKATTAENVLPDNHRIAMHIHVYYPELLSEIISRLSLNQVCPDLLISITHENLRQLVSSMLIDYKGRVVEVLVVPNRGRDIGPLLTSFGQKILDCYDYVGHIHTKKTADLRDFAVGKLWFEFLLENLLGGNSGAMADRILTQMKSDTSVGLVFPDEPNIVGWGANKGYAEALSPRLSLEKLPEFFIFPVGSMFWARTSALTPLINLRLDWEDYPKEPILYDGTILHAIERLLPLSIPTSRYRIFSTNVVGLTR